MHEVQNVPLLSETLMTAKELMSFFGLSSHHQLKQCCDVRQIVKLGHGVFMTPGKTLDRYIGLAFVTRRNAKFHIGGKTALIWHGVLHEAVDEAAEPITVWCETNSRLPLWFTQKFPVRHVWRNPFTKGLPADFGVEPMPQSPAGPRVSVPERALLEMLYDEHGALTVEKISVYMESMRNLRGEVLAPLLKHCHRKRVVSMCVSWAEKLKLPWVIDAIVAAKKTAALSDVPMRSQKGEIRYLKPRNSTFIIRQTNKLARIFLDRMGIKVREGYRFDRANESQEALCWKLACEAQKVLASTNVDDQLVRHHAMLMKKSGRRSPGSNNG